MYFVVDGMELCACFHCFRKYSNYVKHDIIRNLDEQTQMNILNGTLVSCEIDSLKNTPVSKFDERFIIAKEYSIWYIEKSRSFVNLSDYGAIQAFGNIHKP